MSDFQFRCERCSNVWNADRTDLEWCPYCGNPLNAHVNIIRSEPQQTNAKPVNKSLVALAILFMPYVGFFLLVIKKPFSPRTNRAWAIYCVIISIIAFGLIGHYRLYQRSSPATSLSSSTTSSQQQSTSMGKTSPSPNPSPSSSAENSELPNYSVVVQKAVASIYAYPDQVKFYAWTEYAQWESGGIIVVTNKYTLTDSEVVHSYIARCSKPSKNTVGEKSIQIFKLTVDDKVLFYKTDAEDAYLASLK